MSDQDSSHEQTTLTKEIVKTMAKKTINNVFKEVEGGSTDNKKVESGGAPIFQEMERVGLVNVEAMDDSNKKAYDVLKNEGTDAAVKFMFKHPYEKGPDGEGRAMSYSEMRSFYG